MSTVIMPCECLDSIQGGFLNSPFGYRNDPVHKGNSENHTGIDLQPVSPSYYVKAIREGKVIAVKTGVPLNAPRTTNEAQPKGNYVKIQHDNGYTTEYRHLVSVNVSNGTAVEKGRILGAMGPGTTGSSTGPHLHFQVEYKGSPVDPIPILNHEEVKFWGDESIPDDYVSPYIRRVEDKDVIEDDTAYGYLPDIDNIVKNQAEELSTSTFVKIKHVLGIFGLPHQFLPNTDPRIYDKNPRDLGNVENIGYEYAERIVKRIPLVFIAPGKASFMTKYSKKDKESIIGKFLNVFNDDADKTVFGNDIDKGGKYYTFENRFKDYYNYVNPMCRIAARYLELQDVKIDNQPLDQMNWMEYVKNRISSVGDLNDFLSVPFYVDSDTSIGESFDNSTQASLLANTVNNVSDTAKELNFLLGYGAGKKGADEFMNDGIIGDSINNISNMVSRLLGHNGFFSNLQDHLDTVASGGKLIFPEIWSDSSFSRSYSCKFKFISPDASNLSVFLNVLVPLFHLIALVAPQMPENNPNGYTNPFLIRAIYKGFFNVDMGIITSMNVTKGAECQWTPEGVPTSIEVDISIKDLYNAMSITPSSVSNFKFDTINNTSQMDYIANLCGINIYKPEIGRIIDIWWTNNFPNKVKDLFKVNIWGGIQQKVQNTIMNIFR